MYLEELSDRPRFSTRAPIEGRDYAKGTPLDSFILPDAPFSWQEFLELTHDVLKTSKNPQELKLATMLYNAVGDRMGNPWAGDTSRIMQYHKARVALLARTQSKHRDVIVAMLKAGYSISAIANATGLHASSVRRWRHRLMTSDSQSFH
ncbi:helix-turn-helix domain-containing protein [Phyllobacterium meliloti]|uniref:helix-turn-helix domain-containing protein n=1 Tax=Phyllobacterium meliloti TaxID=555317 RepID=UPI001D1526F2|nr:helix-turn-helix domain-containing protein [Phyllobacterium sp. T1293]UGX87156.1 helix-turn-helix domain-containing protein [Phyllobacterium sp. T1293]